MIRTLIVDDEPGVRSALSGVLRDEGYNVEAVESGEACLDRVLRGVVDVIVLDVWLPGLDGLATLARLLSRSPQLSPLQAKALLLNLAEPWPHPKSTTSADLAALSSA